MTSFTIEDEQLASLKDQVVIVTGGSSGIGLATTRLLLELGASVVMGDLSPPPEDLSSPSLTYTRLDVTNWKQLSGVFKKTLELHGRLDHVFANAGVPPIETFMEDEFDQDGELLPPTNKAVEVNLISVIHTVKLAIHHLRKQPQGGSIVMTASASSFQRFVAVDYTTAKHGVLGLMRGLAPILDHLPIRLNALAPGWTVSGMVPLSLRDAGAIVQSPSVVARSAAVLMADRERHGQLIYSDDGKYKEVEETMLATVKGFMLGADGPSISKVAEAVIDEKLRKIGIKK